MKKRTTRTILQDNRRRQSPLRNYFILWLHNIRSLHNVGAAFRNADAFGIQKLLLSGYTPVPPRPEITKTAIGAEEHVIWQQVEKPKHMALQLQKEKYHITGLEQTTTSTLLSEFNPPSQKICLLLGNEVTGIDDNLLPLLDSSVEIPQFGMKHSLNVSVACGIALYGFLEKFREPSHE
ncbi:MAG: TrmH family RNA methyltransferase [Bacteroidetes bacterium]|nr:TrmH family RNA methyltransferase [Bacteroidota bacterium]